MTEFETIRMTSQNKRLRHRLQYVKDKYSDKTNTCISSTGFVMSRKFDYSFVKIDNIFVSGRLGKTWIYNTNEVSVN